MSATQGKSSQYADFFGNLPILAASTDKVSQKNYVRSKCSSGPVESSFNNTRFLEKP